ncbi:MAG TPA: glycosyltransferase family 39 protein, partial [Bacillota bacterium]|nr:glycosyltransferase family 39 protein [Bacillota bacterium]
MKRLSLSSISPTIWLVILVVGCLLPFVNKAFHIDDPLFLWTAQRIHAAPGDFYGFKVNWFGLEMPMIDAMCNPPLMSFLIALASSVVGWGEVPLHLVFLLSAVAAALGTFQAAKRFCAHPLLATSLMVLTPCFLLCSTSLMCDVTMIAFWVWAFVFWERGLTSRRYANFLWAGLLAGLCVLTKYSGLSLVPLLLAYAMIRERKVGNWAFAMLVPVLMLSVYEGIAYRTYGVVLFQQAADFSRQVNPTALAQIPSRLLGGLTFTGGCLLPALLLLPRLWSRRVLLAGTALFLLVFLGHPLLKSLWLGVGGHGVSMAALTRDAQLTLGASWLLELQRTTWLFAGLSIAALAVREYWEHRDATSALLGLWIVGVLVFASVFNWTINGRSILPMLPAAGMLLARRLERT